MKSEELLKFHLKDWVQELEKMNVDIGIKDVASVESFLLRFKQRYQVEALSTVDQRKGNLTLKETLFNSTCPPNNL